MCGFPPTAIRLLFLLGGFSLSGLRASGQDCTKIALAYRPAVVSITVEVEEKKTGALKVREGTGFIITENGVVLTANHVVDADPAVYSVTIKGSVGSLHGNKSPLKLIDRSKEHDIALLKFMDDSKRFNTVPLGDPWSIQPGQRLCALGFPAALGHDYQPSTGILSSRNGPNNLWVTDMPSNYGESGGPVFDVATSKVVAMKFGTIDRSSVTVRVENANYLTPINLAQTLLTVHANIRLPTDAQEQNRPPALLCVESPDDHRNLVDMTLEAYCEGCRDKGFVLLKYWQQPSHSTRVEREGDGKLGGWLGASADASVKLECQRIEDDYLLGLTAHHSSMVERGGTSGDYRSAVSSIAGFASTGFLVEEGNYCLALMEYEQDGERKKGSEASKYFPEGPTRESPIVLRSPKGRAINLKPGISIPLDDKGFWQFKIEVKTSHHAGSPENSGRIFIRSLLRFKFSSRTQGNECPSQGGNKPSPR